ncbi:MAG: delta-aminolevulinic acid dehydratase [Chlamydia sp. 32-24]|nr:MAG: delta-aminolevulinic acid dehydratase [Chlamydia sp. 32-24]
MKELLTNTFFNSKRPRRNRMSNSIRNLVQETRLGVHDLVAPLFVAEGNNSIQPIKSLPGVFRYSIDQLLEEIALLQSLGINAINLFPLIPNAKKSLDGSEAWNNENLICTAIRQIKRFFPNLCVMADVALDPYTTHGHDGIINQKNYVDNDLTLQSLGLMSLALAEAGTDIIAPSDMMDGRVGYLRKILDQNYYTQVGILSYAVKYASSLYGPFREALQSQLQFGDKKTYQMNPANSREALLEAKLDEEEGADILLIKPASLYLDIICKIKESINLPIAAYHVSGEYAMLMAAQQKGWIDGPKVLEETLLSIKRAGADFIFTYGAKEMAQILQNKC